jgi:hypothetical protein
MRQTITSLKPFYSWIGATSSYGGRCIFYHDHEAIQAKLLLFLDVCDFSLHEAFRDPDDQWPSNGEYYDVSGFIEEFTNPSSLPHLCRKPIDGKSADPVDNLRAKKAVILESHLQTAIYLWFNGI